MDNDFLLQRRDLLGGALGVLAGVGGMSAGHSASATPAQAPESIDPVELYRKLHFRSDDGVLFWWLHGPKIGQVGTDLTTLYTNSVGTFMRVQNLGEGAFELTRLEIALLFDRVTGEPLDTWRNPYTGEDIPVRFRPMGPTRIRFGADNSRVSPREIGGTPLETEATTHPPFIVGDDVFLREQSVARVFRPGDQPPFEVNDLAVYHGSLANLTDPNVTVGEAMVFFGEVTSWQDWMGMGQRPGSLTSRLVGRKVTRYEDLPEAWRSRLAQLAPKIAADPVAALDQPAAVFER